MIERRDGHKWLEKMKKIMWKKIWRYFNTDDYLGSWEGADDYFLNIASNKA